MKILTGGIYKNGLRERVGKFIKMPDSLDCYIDGEWRRFANEFEMRAHWPGYVCKAEGRR